MVAPTTLLLSRDAQGMMTRQGAAKVFSTFNEYFTLTAGTVTSITVPNSNALAYVAYFDFTLGADVWVLPAASPTLTVPNGTPTDTLAQLRPDARVVVPGQTIQFLYANTVFSGSTVSVGIQYYANSAKNFMGGPNGI